MKSRNPNRLAREFLEIPAVETQRDKQENSYQHTKQTPDKNEIEPQ